MASVSALGARCMYLSVIVSVLWPTNSWIALGAAPLMARCEQNVCLSTCEPITLSPAFLQPNLSAASMAD